MKGNWRVSGDEKNPEGDGRRWMRGSNDGRLLVLETQLCGGNITTFT